jgi:hypothetical protein
VSSATVWKINAPWVKARQKQLEAAVKKAW